MTEDAPADAKPASSPSTSRLRKYALWSAQALVALLLVDGFVDLAYPSARESVHALRAVVKAVRPEPAAVDVAQRFPGWASYKAHLVPGLGALVEPVAVAGLNVDTLGRRSTGNPPREGARGVLLGSSQAFGQSLRDDATLAAAIERRRTDVTVAAIAGPARTTPESMANWQRVAGKIDPTDFAILFISNVEFYRACEAPMKAQAEARAAAAPSRNAPALIAIPTRALRRFAARTDAPPALAPDARAAVVERALYDLRAALAYGRRETPHFAVVIAPLLYGNDSGAAALRSEFDPEFLKCLDMSVRAFRARVATEDFPEVIDLSGAFDGEGPSYFIDTGSHFNRAGAELLAARMLERLPDGFFAAAPRRPSAAVATAQ